MGMRKASDGAKYRTFYEFPCGDKKKTIRKLGSSYGRLLYYDLAYLPHAKMDFRHHLGCTVHGKRSSKNSCRHRPIEEQPYSRSKSPLYGIMDGSEKGMKDKLRFRRYLCLFG